MKKYLKLTMIFVLLLSFTWVKADDNRVEVESIVATSNMNQNPNYGDPLSTPEFNITVGNEAYFATSNGGWLKYDGEKWIKAYTDSFTSGRWHYYTQIRVDNSYGLTHVLSDSTTVSVDGNNWTVDELNVSSGYSYAWVTSQEFEIPAPTELFFIDSSSFDIENCYIDTPIESFSVSLGAEGGTGPYVFTKVSGPSWINVSSSGEISGTPTALGENDDLVVRVTDSTDAYREITIAVSNTVINPADREELMLIDATSNISSIIGYNKNIEIPTFNITTGSEANFATTNGGWYKYNGTKWERVLSGKFTPGRWHYYTELRVDHDYGFTHVLSDSATVNVDGYNWSMDSVSISPDYSYAWVTSPEYEVKIKLSSLELTGTINPPVIGNEIVNPNISVLSFDNNTSLNNIANIEAVWQYKTGDGFFDWKNATGTFEANKTYHIRFLVTLTNDDYELKNIATYPVTYSDYTLTQFQFNSNSVGEFINFPELKNTVVNKITVSGIVKPVDGQTPKTNITTSTPGVKIESAKWYNEKTGLELKSTDKFVGKEKYYLRIEPSFNIGYVLDENFDKDNSNFTYNSSALTDRLDILMNPTPEVRLYYEATSTNVTAPSVKTKNAGNNTLLVSWDNQTSATKYEVYRSTSKTKNFKKIKTLTTNSFTDKGLVYGKTYYYKVKAIGPKNSKTSSVVSGKTIPNKVKLSIKSASTNNVKLAWNKVNVTGYEVYMGTKTSNMKKVATITKSKTLTYNKTKLKANTKYYFKAKAYKTVSGKKVYGTWSDIVSTKTAPKVAAVSFKQNANNMTVTISKVSGASYHEYAISEIKSFKLGLEAGVMNNSSIIPSIIPVTKGKTYYVKVRTCNSEKRCSAWKVYSKLTK